MLGAVDEGQDPVKIGSQAGQQDEEDVGLVEYARGVQSKWTRASCSPF